MNHKRVISALLALVIILFTVNSCGKKPPADPDAETETPSPLDNEDDNVLSDGPSHSEGSSTASPDASYAQGEYWRLTEDSAIFLPLETGETPAAYFERMQPQATAEAEPYIQEVCLPELEDFQAKYGGTKTGETFYEDGRIDGLEPAGVFCRDGTRYLVYILDYSAHVTPGTQLFFAGGMSVDDEQWMDPGPGHILALSLEEDGSVQLSFGYQGDIFPHDYGEDQEFFQQDFSNQLAQHLQGTTE